MMKENNNEEKTMGLDIIVSSIPHDEKTKEVWDAIFDQYPNIAKSIILAMNLVDNTPIAMEHIENILLNICGFSLFTTLNNQELVRKCFTNKKKED